MRGSETTLVRIHDRIQKPANGFQKKGIFHKHGSTNWTWVRIQKPTNGFQKKKVCFINMGGEYQLDLELEYAPNSKI